MRYLLTLLFAALSLNAIGQMPYNPDSNGDYAIGSPDLLSFLGVFDTMLVDSSLTCDYEGTDLETLIGGIFSQTLILDSVYIEYLLIDTVLTYLPGCPDPVYIDVILERSYLCTGFDYYESPDYMRLDAVINYLGHTRVIYFWFYYLNGYYTINVNDAEVGILTSYSDNAESNNSLIPFPESWTLDENGVQVDWIPNTWVANCSNFRLIPYWHLAE